MKQSAKIKNAQKLQLNEQNIEETIRTLHASSHFAPTGKNPESSRGHICYVTTVHLKYFHDDKQNGTNSTLSASENLVAHWIVVDLAGSEGESAITASFEKTAEASEVMARRMEAWCINHGLSQLQIIFNELRGKKKKEISKGTGLKKTLSEFISTKSQIAVLFTISPSLNNSKSTEATLRFAESAALVKCTPIKAKKKVNKDILIQELYNIIKQKDDEIERLKQNNIINIKHNDEKVENIDLEQLEPITFDENHLIKRKRSNYNKLKINLNANGIESLLENIENEEEKMWKATKSEFLSLEENEDLEQSMKDQMSDNRRRSRASADIQIASQIFTSNIIEKGNVSPFDGSHSSITSIRSFMGRDNRINTIVERSILSEDEEDFDDNFKPNKSKKIKKILKEHKNGYEVHSNSLTNLNKKELVYLCSYFAKKRNQRIKDETDKIIESHEEQIQFLSKELNRLQKFHRFEDEMDINMDSLQSKPIQLNMMMMDDLDDLDEKFEQNTPSSTRIDPITNYQEPDENDWLCSKSPINLKNKEKHNKNNNDSVLDVEDDEKVHVVDDGQREKGCTDHCIIQ